MLNLFKCSLLDLAQKKKLKEKEIKEAAKEIANAQPETPQRKPVPPDFKVGVALFQILSFLRAIKFRRPVFFFPKNCSFCDLLVIKRTMLILATSGEQKYAKNSLYVILLIYFIVKAWFPIV